MFGEKKTWKIEYHLLAEQRNNGAMGVVFVEAENRQDAMCKY